MNQDEIIEMARQAGFEGFDKWAEHYPQETKRWCERMEAFAKLVAAKEREACAKVCEQHTDGMTMLGGAYIACATAVRARGEA